MTPDTRAELLRLCEEAADGTPGSVASPLIRLGFAARSALPDLLAENERLTESQEEYRSATDKLLTSRSSDLWVVAEDRDRLKAENERLRAALKPFAEADDPSRKCDSKHDDETATCLFGWCDLRRAAEALAGTPDERPINQGV